MSRKALLLIVAVCGLALLLATTATARTGHGDDGMLARYEPVMQFDPLEQFLPTRVKSFTADADLEQLTDAGAWILAASHPAPRDLPGPGSGTWRLNQDTCTPAAPIGGLSCYSAAAAAHGGKPVVYGRVTHEDSEIVLQYWFFYYDDVYSYAYPPSDFIWQAHEGDWESVSIVLSGDEQPLFVGYSQHCLGQRQAWAETTRFDDTHPIVHVAIGSHANYFSAGTHPINVSCIPPAAVAILQRNGLPLPVDFAFAGAIAGPKEADGTVMRVRDIGEDPPNWVQFPGFWGELQFFHAPAPIGTVPFGTSPVGPAFHAEWTDPLGTLATWPMG